MRNKQRVACGAPDLLAFFCVNCAVEKEKQKKNEKRVETVQAVRRRITIPRGNK